MLRSRQENALKMFSCLQLKLWLVTGSSFGKLFYCRNIFESCFVFYQKGEPECSFIEKVERQ